jgi:hypothetical protein
MTEVMKDETERCSGCGYSVEDARINGDHRLCMNAGNAPWEKGGRLLTVPPILSFYLRQLNDDDAERVWLYLDSVLQPFMT